MESQAERIRALEEWQRQAREEFSHIHACVHQMKDKVDKWDSRFKIAMAFVAALILAAGSGPLSVKTLLDWITRLAK